MQHCSAMACRMCSGAGSHVALVSISEFITTRKQAQRQTCQRRAACTRNDQAGDWRKIGNAKKAITESVNYIEKRIQAGNGMPERRQGMDGIEHARQQGQRRNQKILE